MVERGTIRLHDAVQTGLDAGLYRVTIGVDLTLQGSLFGTTLTIPDSFTAERYVSVEAPRYRLDETDLLTAQPMPGSRTEAGGQLPWVALRRRTLPWERRGPVDDQAVPWLALLLTRDDEAALGSASNLAQIVGATAAGRYGETPDVPLAGLVFPTAPALLAMLPTPDEARLLCHVREFDVTDTELSGGDQDGWAAVVLGNRLVTGEQEATWRATLVSLEHRDDLAARRPETSAVLALATWTFVDTPGSSFASALAGLDVGLFGTVPGADHSGVSLVRTDHAGGTETVRYRSPLTTAAAGGPDPSAPPDVTMTAAHHLGRLLAAADGRVVGELVEMRRQRLLGAAETITRNVLAGGEPGQPVTRALGHLARRAGSVRSAPVRPARPVRLDLTVEREEGPA